MIVLVVNGFLATFRGQPGDSEKGSTYMRKRFKAIRVAERGRRIRERQIGKWTGGFLNLGQVWFGLLGFMAYQPL